MVSILAGCVVAPARYRENPREVYRDPYRSPPPVAEPMYFYPERGQGESLQDRDRYECYRWAVSQTGTDPGMQPVQRSLARPEPVQRDPGAAVAGGVAGAIIGGAMASPRNAGAGLVLGAIFGSALGAAAEEGRAQRAEQMQDYRQREYEARQLGTSRDFRRAMSVCMSGRGYVVR